MTMARRGQGLLPLALLELLLVVEPLVPWRATSPAVGEQQEVPISADEALWSGMERSKMAAEQRYWPTQDEREQFVQAQWKAAQSLFEKGLEVFEAQQPSLPWDPAGSPGPQLLLEAARALYYLNQPHAALAKLTRLETVLPPGNDRQLHGIVQQWAFRSHLVARDYAGASARLQRLLSRHGVQDLETVAVANLSHAWRQLSLPRDSQLQAAEALSRDVGATHPRSAVRIWELLQDSSLLPWSAVQRRARGGDITRAGREHWVLFMTSLHRCMGLPGTEIAAQQHRTACNELLLRHWTELRRFGSWVHPCVRAHLCHKSVFQCTIALLLLSLPCDHHPLRSVVCGMHVCVGGIALTALQGSVPAGVRSIAAAGATSSWPTARLAEQL